MLLLGFKAAAEAILPWQKGRELFLLTSGQRDSIFWLMREALLPTLAVS